MSTRPAKDSGRGAGGTDDDLEPKARSALPLPDDEGAQLRFEFETELARLEAA